MTIFIDMDTKTYNKLRREKLKELGYYVYAYLDPTDEGEFIYDGIELTHRPFYIGKGFGYRINVHMYPCNLNRKNHKNNKIKKILSLGLVPIKVKIYEGLLEQVSLIKEVEIINLIGFENLTNVTHGGEGTSGFEHTTKTKKKIGSGNRGKKHTDETKELISEKLKGRVIDQGWKDKISKTTKGKLKKPFTDEHKKNIAESGKGRIPWNKGCKGCQEAWNKGLEMTKEMRENMSKAKLGKTGNIKSDESKKKISDSLKNYHNKRKNSDL